MAAAGGGLPASAAIVSASPWAVARCRFPGRPWTPRSRLKTGKRLKVGRLGLEAARVGCEEERPGDVEVTLREDPTLLQLLKLGQKLAHRREAGFCTSDEEEEFTGFQVAGRRPSRSGQGISQRTPLKSLPSPETLLLGSDSPAPRKGSKAAAETEKTSRSEKIKRRGGEGLRTRRNVARPKLVVKLACKTVPSKNLSSRPQVEKTLGLKPSRKNRDKRESVEDVEDQLLAEPGYEDVTAETEMEKSSRMPRSRKRQKKLVWNLTLIKRKALSVSLKHANRQNISDVKSSSPEVATDIQPQDLVSTDGIDDTQSLTHASHKLGRRKTVFGNRRKPWRKISETQEPAEVKPPRKRRRLVKYIYEDLELPLSQEQRTDESTRMENAAHGSVVSARPSRVIKVPKRFMDDEELSGLPTKKPVQTEIQDDESCESAKTDVSQVQKLGSKRKSGKRQNLGDDEDTFVEKSEGGKSSGFSGARKKAVRPGYDSSHLKIYEKLKKLTASLARRKEQRMASRQSSGICEKPDEATQGASTCSTELASLKTSDIKIGDLDCPGVVCKLAIHGEHKGRQSALCYAGKTKALAESSPTNNEQLTSDASTSQVVVAPGGSVYKINLSGANKKMLHLLKRAKVQLIKIDQQKQMKTAQLMSDKAGAENATSMSITGRRRRKVVRTDDEEVPQGHLVGGPRIKHVCRAAAVALGQPRAMIPDDIPRLSALPLHEREGISPLPDTEDQGSHSEPESTGSAEPRPGYRRRFFRVGQNRCLQCKGCLRIEDCETCVFCLDKPKFGGPNKKRQSCIYKKCERMQESKMKRLKVQMKRRADAYGGAEEAGEVDGTLDCSSPVELSNASPSRRPRRQVPRRCFSDLLDSESTDTAASDTETEKEQISSVPVTQTNDTIAPSDTQVDVLKPRKPGLPRGPWGRRKIDKSSVEHTARSVLPTLNNGFVQRLAQEAAHKIRVDFKEDCHIQNVWAMGGLSVLTSAPITPECVCLLCASKGHHDMIFCQMCCEPFHRFCLPADDRPQKENRQNWCCRRCKFCRVCGRKSKPGKPVLQCKKCFYCYHPSCLGPTYPKPDKCNTSWTCMLCIRCKSCGVTPGKSWELNWNHELSLCCVCSDHYKQGNFCTVCLKCYSEHEFDRKMMQCARCAHWVHPKCEGLTDDMHEILSRLRGKSLVFSCAACSEHFPSGWQEVVQSVLQSGLEKVMNSLRISPTTRHLQICSQCKASPDSEIIKERNVVCDLHSVVRKLQEGLYTSLKAFHEDVVVVMTRKLQQEKSLPEEKRPTAQAKAFYIKLLEQTFSWFNSRDPKTWMPVTKEFPSCMIPGAIIPPSKEHSYAQWLKKHDRTTKTTNKNQENIHLKAQAADTLNVNQSALDARHCSLCQQQGEAKPSEAGRLLYLGQNEWAHINCCIWSAEVQEVKGALLNVYSAVARGRFLRCERCNQTGATVGCCLASCHSNYHFMCARASHCVFQIDKKVYCHKHRDLINNKMVNGFEVLRRVYVDFDGINLRRKFLTGLEPECINVVIGSLHIQKLGVLTELSANAGKLYPVGYQCTRWYWSTVDPRKRCKYTCKVMDVRHAYHRRNPNLGQNEKNCTIAHSPKPQKDVDLDTDVAIQLTPTTPSPNSKMHSGTESKTPMHHHNRRPAGGTFRPLPSPGSAVSSSHHILTISDLDDTRRSRRLFSRSRNASPPHSPLSPMKIGSRGGLHPRSLSGSSPVSPVSARESPISPHSPRRRGRPPSSPSSATSAYSPRQGVVGSPPSTAVLSPCHSPRNLQHFKATPPESAEVPRDFSAEIPELGISMTAVLEDGVADQDLLCTHFDADTEVAVASVLNEKLEFDEALLNDDVTLHCGLYGSTGEVQDLAKEVHTEGLTEVDSADEDSARYFNFSRTVVVCDSAKDSAQPGVSTPPTSKSISQLDGADNDSESDTGEANGEVSYHGQDKKPSNSNGGEESQEFHESLSLQESVDMLVDCITEVSTHQEGASAGDLIGQDVPFSSTVDVPDVPSTSPVFYTSSEFVAGHQDIIADSKPVAELNELWLDPVSGNFISPHDGSLIQISDTPTSVPVPVKIDVKPPEAKILPRPPGGKLRIIASRPPVHRNIIIPQHRLLKVAVPAGMSLPLSLPVNVLPASPGLPQKNHVTSSPVVINGLDSHPKTATKGRAIAIRIPSTTKPSLTGASSSPQVLLINRSGQILIKDPQTNTYQIPNANSQPYNQISQIAKVIHSQNLVQRIMLSPVPQASPSQSPTTRIVSYINGSVPPTKVLLKTVPQQSSEVQMSIANPNKERTSDVKLKNVSVPVSPVFGRSQEDKAQSILERAMATHRDVASPTAIKPHQFQLHQYLEKFHQSPELKIQHKPTILSHSKPQVRVKRVSSASDRISIGQCNTITEPTVPSSQDELNRLNKVRIKAPTMKDVLDLDRPQAENPGQPKIKEAKESESKRITSEESEPSDPPQTEKDKHDNTHDWVSSRNSDLSDWGPCAGWSSDEDGPSPEKEGDGCVSQGQPHLLFKITSDDGFSVEADSIEVAWKAVVDGVQEARIGHRLEQLPLGRISGARVLGVVHDAVLFLLEQLQGAGQCHSYNFRFHQQENAEEELPINPSGCARAEVYTRNATFDMFNFLASQHRQLPESRPCDDDEDEVKLKSSRRATSMELPMAMRFRHLEKTSKEAVGVYRSEIHGRGLFCKRNIEAGEMVIEYAGIVIRSILTDKRENYYSSKGIGCYMFRIDDFDVVDATTHGNAARFINHSCEPNCYSRVINVEGQKHIVIFALRKIYRGEELTYDYKFPIEDANSKLHCNCGARRCRRFLN
ncbi:histone-lysine N-methyltransferase 2B [Trichomycterus rosablanca]|uniref:histone-lysine N-methyltransferase 2B n=1 Tax=Trichomycterus rosablanca TaxID=2290929 RepID=UPI002F34F7D5